MKHDLETLRKTYEDMRRACTVLETEVDYFAVAHRKAMPPSKLKRLDKTVTLIKVGLKLLKKTL